MEHQTTSSCPSIPTTHGGTLSFFGLTTGRRAMFKITDITLHSAVGFQTSFRYVFGSKAVCDEMFICPSPCNHEKTNISFCLLVEKDDLREGTSQLILREYLQKVKELFTQALVLGRHTISETKLVSSQNLEEEVLLV